MALAAITIVYPRSFIIDTIPLDSDVASATGHNSDSALLLATIFCVRVCAFQHVTADRVSLQPTQSESEYVVTSVLI